MMRKASLAIVVLTSAALAGPLADRTIRAQQPVAPGPAAGPAAGNPPATAPQGGDPAAAGRGRQGGRGGRGGIAVEPGQPCPPGTTMTRPLRCQAPEFPAPSIVDYTPRSTLVTPVHLVPKAKYPAIDIHGHGANMLSTPEGLNTLVAELDKLNVGLFVSADTMSGERLGRALDVVRNSPHKDRVRIFTGVAFGQLEPGFGERAARQLEADIKAGAVGIGEISKSFGLTLRKPDGSRLRVDDPELDPVWATAARLNIPVFIHTAEPQEFFQPLDMRNERWLELSLFRDRRNNQPGQVTFEELMTERDNLFRKHPKTTFIAAHFGWHANDLARLGQLLDSFPNVVVEAGAILYDLGRQPRTAREFMTKYQDRVLFGKDAFEPSEYPYYWRVFETNDEYFDYYRDYHAFWKLYGLGLSDDVLKKLYYRNALRITPGLPQSGWPR
jgi:predicted TIM-barrel fold metal-dependent hydrolase